MFIAQVKITSTFWPGFCCFDVCKLCYFQRQNQPHTIAYMLPQFHALIGLHLDHTGQTLNPKEQNSCWKLQAETREVYVHGGRIGHQVIGSLISAITCLGTSWWLLTSIPNICNPALLPAGSPWSCPSDGVYYTSSVIWGLVGPLRTFGPLGLYNSLNWFFLAGALAPLPVWVATKLLPKSTWIRWINIPVLLMGGLTMPPASAINNIMFLTVGLIFNYLIFRHYKAWWKRYTYVLSAALDAGTAFMGIALWIFLGQTTQGGLDWWGNQGNHCPLAQCPTAPDVAVPGCPVFSRL